MKTPRFTSQAVAVGFMVVSSGFAGTMEPSLGVTLAAQQPPPAPQRAPFLGPTPAPSPIERLGPDVLRVGNVRIDVAKKELSVTGVVNEVQGLEFLANTKGGFKSYESALELDTNAVNFNVGCILIGLDPARAVPSRFQFEPNPPKGDPVEIFIEWESDGGRRRIRAEELIFNRVTKTSLSEGPWVYTGSVFLAQNNRYLAETDGTLIGFMHTPSPIIESPRPLAGAYGTDIINPSLNLKPGTSVLLIVRAVPQ